MFHLAPKSIRSLPINHLAIAQTCQNSVTAIIYYCLFVQVFSLDSGSSASDCRCVGGGCRLQSPSLSSLFYEVPQECSYFGDGRVSRGPFKALVYNWHILSLLPVYQLTKKSSHGQFKVRRQRSRLHPQSGCGVLWMEAWNLLCKLPQFESLREIN